MSGDKVVRVTNQGELDEALKADPSDDVVIEIHADPGRYASIYIFVTDSRGHAIEARGESCVIASGAARLTARAAARVVARGAASVYAYNQAVVETRGDVDVTAYGQSVVYCEGGEVYAHEHATVYVMEDADRPSVEGVPTVVVHDFKGDTPVTGGAVVIAG